jgi:hypothetical protein
MIVVGLKEGRLFSVASMQHSGIEESAALMFLDSTAVHRGYGAIASYPPGGGYPVPRMASFEPSMEPGVHCAV